MPARKHVIVRTRDAGVHIGDLVKHDGITVKLANARRLWRWRGANTLNEVATVGVSQDWTRISEPVKSIVIVGVAEIIPTTAQARETFASRWPS